MLDKLQKNHNLKRREAFDEAQNYFKHNDKVLTTKAHLSPQTK